MGTAIEGRLRLNVAMTETLLAHADFEALGCVEIRSGNVVASVTREGRSLEVLEAAAMAASQLCVAPRLEASEDETAEASEALVVSREGVHAFVRARWRPGQAMVGIARGGANVALMLVSLRSLAAARDGE